MKTYRIFTALFTSLILSACSGGSGGSAGDPITQTKLSSENRTKLVATTSAIADLSSAEGIKALLTTISGQDNLSGNCSTSSSSNCRSGLSDGTVLGSYERSYSSYAVIRSEAERNATSEDKQENIPVNTYVALVTNPTSSVDAVVDATYSGVVSYTKQNGRNILTRNGLTMRVQNGVVSGEITVTSAKGVISNVITFDSASVKKENDLVSFSGDATFAARYFYTSNTVEGDIKGSYQGVFAGDHAEEMVGTFHSNNTTKISSVQGAFSAAK